MAGIRRPCGRPPEIVGPSLVSVRRVSFLLLGAVLLGTAACGSGGGNAQAGSPSGGTTNPSPTATATLSPTATVSGPADVGCLVSGSPWHVSLRDLESQLPRLMHGIHVTSVHIDGEQSLTVDSGLHGTFTDNSTTTIKVSMSNSMNMVLVQRHHGSASGTWRAQDGKLIGIGQWSGGIHGSTQVSINGRASQAPFQAPTVEIGQHPMTFSCENGSLMLTVQGSPFSYLLTRS